MLILALCTFIDVLGYNLILPLLPQIVKLYSDSDLVIGLIISSNALTALIFGPILGKLSDRHGRKVMLAISMLGTTGSFILLLLSTDTWGILLSRIFDGVFSGQIPIIRAYTSDVTSTKERSTVMGKMTASFALALVIGPSIGGVLGQVNWRIPVVFGITSSIIGTILVLKLLEESLPREKRQFLAKERHTRRTSRELVPSLFTRPMILRLAMLFLQMLAFNSFVSSLPIVLSERFGSSPLEIGLLYSTFGLETVIFSAIMLGRVSRRLGEARMLVWSVVLLVVSFFIYPFLDQYWILFIFVTPPTVALAMFRPVVQANLTKAAPPSRQGEANGWGTNMQGLAQVFAPLISTGYLEAGGIVVLGVFIDAYFAIGWTMTALFLVLLVLSVLDVKRYPGDFEPPVGRGG